MDQSKFNVPHEAPETDLRVRVWPDQWSEPDEEGEEHLEKVGVTAFEMSNAHGAMNAVFRGDVVTSTFRGLSSLASGLVSDGSLSGLLGGLLGVRPEHGVGVEVPQPVEPPPCEGCRYYAIVITREDGEPVAAEARMAAAAYLEVFWRPGVPRKLDITQADLEQGLSAELTNRLGTSHFVWLLPESEMLTTLLPLGFADEPDEAG